MQETSSYTPMQALTTIEALHSHELLMPSILIGASFSKSSGVDVGPWGGAPQEL